MGNQEKAEKGDTVVATSTRLFKGRVVEDSIDKKGESLLASTPVVVLSAILGRTSQRLMNIKIMLLRAST